MTSNPNPDRVNELHQQARADYARGQAERERAAQAGARPLASPNPSNLDTAIYVAREMLALYGDPVRFDLSITAYAQAHGALTESLRILLRALDAEPEAAVIHLNNEQPAPRTGPNRLSRAENLERGEGR